MLTDADHIRIGAPSGAEQTYQMRVLTWAPSPAQLPPGPAALLVVPRATARLLAAAQAAGWSVVTEAGSARIRLADECVSLDTRQPADEGVSGPRHRPPWTTVTTVRSLLADAPQPQRVLAFRTGTSQARISQILALLAASGLVVRTPVGFAPVDWNALADWRLERYCGHRGASAYWYSLDALRTQVGTAVDALMAVDGSDPVLSGDVAADPIAPWRRPVQAIIYAHRLADLADLGFVPAARATDATVVLHAPRDPGVWPARPWRRDVDGRPVALADPMQILFDLAGDDDKEAAERIRAVLRDGPLRQAAART